MVDNLAGVELEALRSTYQDAELKILEEEPLEILAKIIPRATDSCCQQFVCLDLRLRTSATYPEEAAQISLLDVRGLDEVRMGRVEEDLQQQAASMVGELMLGHIIEAAKDLLTELNHPTGDCAICLEPLRNSSGDQAAEAVEKLPCYHCMHRSCFASWFAAEQVAKRDQRAQLQHGRKHAVTSQMLGKLGLQTSQHGLFTLLCPHCRNPLDLAAFSKADIKALAEEARSKKHCGEQSLMQLPEDNIQTLRLMQRQQQAMLERQRLRGGLVPETYAVALR